MECKNQKPLPPCQKRLESMKENIMEEIDMAAWDVGDRMREMRVAIGRLFASQSDHGHSI